MTDQHRALLDIMQGYRGRHNAVRRSIVLDALWARGVRIKDSAMRILKEELWGTYHEPIGSTMWGYFMCVDDEDYAVSIAMLENKVNDLHWKIKLHREIQQERLGRQLELVLR